MIAPSSSHPDLHLEAVTEAVHNISLFTRGDFTTFVVPNTVFGIASALSNRLMSGNTSHVSTVVKRLPLIIFFNWSNLLIFVLANQRLPESVKEDKLNKPWRPIPSGRMTQRQTRHLLILLMPVILLLNYALGVWKETALLFSLTWVYNDLRGGDDNWLVRNLVIALAFFYYNLGSLKLAMGVSNIDMDQTLSNAAYAWTVAMSAIIATTMHVQDLQDQAGDIAGGRQTAPLAIGDAAARWTIAVPGDEEARQR
ncbi:MAG: hypothetical protein Q9222_002448 [Ikaeria aurantiellina]